MSTSVKQYPEETASIPNVFYNVLPFGEMDEFVERKFFKKGQVLFNPGAIARGLYFIVQGKLKVSRHGSNAKEQIIKILSTGDVIGHEALLFKKRFSDFAEVLEDADILYMDARDFDLLCHQHPQIMEYFVKLLCADLLRMEEKLVSIAYEPVRGRLASLLLELEGIYKEGSAAVINLSRSDLAKLAGMSKETAIRLLTEFKNENLIQSDGQDVRIMDREGLLKICQLYI